MRGRLDDAEREFRRALAIDERHFGPDNPHLAYPLHGLANVARDQGQFAEAERLCRRTLTIRERGLGPDHPAVAETLAGYAKLLNAMGQQDAAHSPAARAAAKRDADR